MGKACLHVVIIASLDTASCKSSYNRWAGARAARCGGNVSVNVRPAATATHHDAWETQTLAASFYSFFSLLKSFKLLEKKKAIRIEQASSVARFIPKDFQIPEPFRATHCFKCSLQSDGIYILGDSVTDARNMFIITPTVPHCCFPYPSSFHRIFQNPIWNKVSLNILFNIGRTDCYRHKAFYQTLRTLHPSFFFLYSSILLCPFSLEDNISEKPAKCSKFAFLLSSRQNVDELSVGPRINKYSFPLLKGLTRWCRVLDCGKCVRQGLQQFAKHSSHTRQCVQLRRTFTLLSKGHRIGGGRWSLAKW